MNEPSFVLGTHKKNDDWPITPIEKICILCDKKMFMSGYGTDTADGKTYKIESNEKNLAIECVMTLAEKIAIALDQGQKLREMLPKKYVR